MLAPQLVSARKSLLNRLGKQSSIDIVDASADRLNHASLESRAFALGSSSPLEGILAAKYERPRPCSVMRTREFFAASFTREGFR